MIKFANLQNLQQLQNLQEKKEFFAFPSKVRLSGVIYKNPLLFLVLPFAQTLTPWEAHPQSCYGIHSRTKNRHTNVLSILFLLSSYVIYCFNYK